MRTFLLWLVAVVVCVLVALWIGSAVLTSVTADREWPNGLGKLSDVPKRNPPTWESESASELVRLAAAANIELRPGVRGSTISKTGQPRQALERYVRAQVERSGDTIDAPPAELAQWLAENEEPLDAIRDHLLNAEEVVWASDPRNEVSPVPNLAGHILLNRILTARAFEKAYHGDAASWQELQAGHALTRSLWRRPEVVSIMIAIASARTMNAAARKMPLPAPAWLAETFTFDYDAAASRAQQAEAWRMRGNDARPLEHFRAVREAERMRRINEEVLRLKVCDITSAQFDRMRATFASRRTPSILGAWQRFLRFRVEREATQRVLQIRSGQMPSRESQCSDGSWQVTPTSAKFTREVKLDLPGLRIPLEYSR